MKKIIAMALLVLFLASCTVNKEDDKLPENPGAGTLIDAKQNDTGVPDSPSVLEPEAGEERSDILLEFRIENEKPVLSWSKYPSEFRNYVVLKSIVSDTPDYPGEDSIETIWNPNETSYTDKYPDGGVSYYRVVAVNKLIHVVKSNIVKIELPDPKETPDQELNLRAEKINGMVNLTWDRYNGGFRSYIVVSTTKHPYPKYPDDILEKTIPFVNQTSYLVKPQPGVNYYAISVIRPDKTKFTSNRIMIEI